MGIEITNLTHAYSKASQPAVDALSLSVPTGCFQVLLGPSGCGKTTTMRCIAGLEDPQRGRIVVNGDVMVNTDDGTYVPVHQRNVGMVFQSYAIWPHKTVEQNVAFPLRMQKIGKKEIRSRVGDVLASVGLEHLRNRGASQLSGGQMQRVALARSIAMRPEVLLFDEPLSNLDARLRDSLRFELRALQQDYGFTALYVTHDQSEALALGDKIAVMDAGRIVQQGTPRELYNRPHSEFVARFLGVGNVLQGKANPGSSGDRNLSDIEVPALNMTLQAESQLTGNVSLCIREESLDLVAQNEPLDREANTFDGRVEVASFLGSEVHYQVLIGETVRLRSFRPASDAEFKPGDQVRVRVLPSAIHVVERELNTAPHDPDVAEPVTSA